VATDVVELFEELELDPGTVPVDAVPFPPTGKIPVVVFAPPGAEPEGAVPFPPAVIVILAPLAPELGGEPDGAVPLSILVLLPPGPLPLGLPPMLLVKAYPPSAVYAAAAWMV